MGLVTRARRIEDALASLSYEGCVVVGSLLTFYVLYTQLGDDYGVLVGVAGLSGTVTLAMVSWCQPWLLEAVLKHGRPLGQCVRHVMRLAVMATIASVVLVVGLGVLLVPDAQLPVLVAGGLADGLANGAAFLLVGVIQLRSTYVRATLIRIAVSLVRPAVVVVLLLVDRVSLLNYMIGIATLFTVCVVTIWNMVRIGLRDGPVVESLRTGSIVAEGAPYGVVSLTWALQEDFDKTLLNTYGFAREAGTYAAGYKFVQMATLPIKAVVSASHHRFLREEDSPRTHLRRAVRLTALSVAYAVVATVGLLIALHFIARYGGSEFQQAVTPARMLSGLIVLRALVWYPFNALLAFSLRRQRMFILVGTSVLNLGLNIAFIPAFSWKAALWSTYVTEIAFGLASWIAVLRAVAAAEASDHPPIEPRAGSSDGPHPDDERLSASSRNQPKG